MDENKSNDAEPVELTVTNGEASESTKKVDVDAADSTCESASIELGPLKEAETQREELNEPNQSKECLNEPIGSGSLKEAETENKQTNEPNEPAGSDPVFNEQDTESGQLVSKPTKRKRLAQDVIGRLEDAVAFNSKDVESWRRLIAELKNKGNLVEVGAAFERMVTIFPTSADTWIDYIGTELENGEFAKVEQLFARCLTKVLNVKLWEFYLSYVRRTNNLSTDGDRARNTISQAYEFILDRIGIDIESGSLWSQYIEFIRGKDTSTTWEEQQKMDLLRKTYRRAIVIPLKNLESLWQNYNSFENNLNKTTARKFINEKSGAYMNARGALRELRNITQELNRDTTPSPRKWIQAEKSDFMQWKKWIDWEKGNPLGFDNPKDIKTRVSYAYSQAMMSMRYYPEIFFSAALYYVELEFIEDAIDLLNIGIQANPASFLLSLKLAEIYESDHKFTELKNSFERLIKNLKAERNRLSRNLEEEEAEIQDVDNNLTELQKQQSDILRTQITENLQMNSKDITIAYTHYMKAMERSNGIKEARRVFGEARKLSYSTYHIYICSAMIEYHTNREPVIASKIFEVGLKRFSENPDYVKAYFDYLVLIKDNTNARALFEKSVVKMEPDMAQPLYEHVLRYESEYGELSALLKLEQRYLELYPQTSKVDLFANRYKTMGYDPIREIDMGQRFTSYTTESSSSLEVGTSSQASFEHSDKVDEQPPVKRARENEMPISIVEQTQVMLPADIYVLLRALPPANAAYGPVAFDAAKLVKLIKEVNTSSHSV